MNKLDELIKEIKPADRAAMALARERQDALAKPPGSLGGLEDIAIRISGMTGKLFNTMDRGCVAVFCADNGVVCEGVASAPQSVTMAQTVNFARRLTGVGALAKSFGSELLIVDMGVKDPIPQELYIKEPLLDTHKIVDRRLRHDTGQTGNIAVEPAMSLEEALKAIETGVEMADAIAAAGFEIMGVGEMGIGNTTTSAALLSAMTGCSAQETAGRGGGVNDRGFLRKKEIVDAVSLEYRQAGGILAKAGSDAATGEHATDGGGPGTGGGPAAGPEIGGPATGEHATDGGGPGTGGGPATGPELMLAALSRMGGFDICAMTGAYLGAARNHMPVVIDGYISVVAALAAYIIAPASRDYMIASHKSFEKGYGKAIEILELKPFMALDMRLGEGSGCPVAFKIIKGACDVMANMATFDEAAINDDYLEEIRSQAKFQK